MSNKTDLELIQDVKNGDKKAFEEIMVRHEKFLMKIVVRMTRDMDAAEDIVQDSFIKAYKRLHLFEGRSSLRSWLYQIALNTTRNRFRKGSREVIGTDGMDIAVEGEMEKLYNDIELLLTVELTIQEDLSCKRSQIINFFKRRSN